MLILLLFLGGTAQADSIWGKVTDSDGAGLGGVQVNVFEFEGDPSIVGSVTTTNSDGDYLVDGLASGSYKLQAVNQTDDYVDEWYADLPVGPGTLEHATPITLPLSDPIDFVLGDGRTIRGRVTDNRFLGLAGVRVQAWGYNGSWYVETVTNASGAYELRGLVPSQYAVRTAGDGYLNEWYDDLPVSTNSQEDADLVDIRSENRSGVDFVLGGTNEIWGVVRDEATGRGLEGVEVLAYPANYPLALPAVTTAADGSYRIPNVLPRPHNIRTRNSLGYVDEWYNDLPVGPFTQAAALDVDCSQAATGPIDFSLEMGRVIAGQVTDESGAGISGAYLLAYGTSGWSVPLVTTDAEGRYQIRALPPDVYKLRTMNSRGYLDEWFDDLPVSDHVRADATPIDVQVQDATDVDFSLVGNRQISGRVTDLSGAPLANVIVYAYLDGSTAGRAGITDSQGAYKIEGLGPGIYRVRTAANTRGYVDEWYLDLPVGPYSRSQATAVDVSIANAAGIDFALQPGREISGTVRDLFGNPIRGIKVLSFGPENWSGPDATSDGQGVYRIKGLLPAVYKVRTENSLGYWDEWFDDLAVAEFSAADATPVDVETVDAAGIDFDLRPAQGERSILGHVRDEAGVGLPEVRVEAYTSTGLLAGWAVSDVDGAYAISDLPTGYYRARTVNDQGLFDEWYDDKPVIFYTRFQANLVNVNAGDALGVDFYLARPRTIFGIVTDDGPEREPAEAAVPLPGVEVIAYSADRAWQASAVTLPDGSYRIEGLYPGNYRVRTNDAAPYADEWYDDLFVGRFSEQDADLVDVVPGDARADFMLTLGRTICGRVVNASGAGIPQVRVWAYSEGIVWSTSTFTQADGTYCITGLAPAAYRVRTWNTLGYTDEWYDDLSVNEYEWFESQLVDVTADSRIGIDFVLDGGPTNVSLSLPLAAGWNLIAGDSGSDILGLTLFAYEGGSYRTLTSADMQPGRGYWVRTDSPVEAQIRVTSPPVLAHVVPGWNLIGNSSSSTVVLPSGVTAFVYAAGRYQSTTTLEPGQGAWVRATVEGDLVMGPVSSG